MDTSIDMRDKRRKISVIYNGYPGEDPFVQQVISATEEESRRPSYIGLFQRSSPEGDSDSGHGSPREHHDSDSKEHDNAK